MKEKKAGSYTAVSFTYIKRSLQALQQKKGSSIYSLEGGKGRYVLDFKRVPKPVLRGKQREKREYRGKRKSSWTFVCGSGGGKREAHRDEPRCCGGMP